jgi:hypothetical protein
MITYHHFLTAAGYLGLIAMVAVIIKSLFKFARWFVS